MKTTLSVLTICLAAACGGTGGSVSNTSSTAISSIPVGGGTSGSAPGSPSPVEASITAVEVSTDRSFAGMLNAVRAVNGSDPVGYNAQLGVAAQRHADDMLANDFFAHRGSDGSNAGQRITAAGYDWSTWGENLGKGYPDEEAVLLGWVTSTTGHQENNINPAFEDFALEKAGAGNNQYWVLVLGAER